MEQRNIGTTESRRRPADGGYAGRDGKREYEVAGSEESGHRREEDLTTYEIRVKGHLDSRWSEWFDGLEITNLENGEAALSGDIVDQAALHGLLTRVRDLGLPLVGVRKLDPQGEQDSARTPTSGTGRGGGPPLL